MRNTSCIDHTTSKFVAHLQLMRARTLPGVRTRSGTALKGSRCMQVFGNSVYYMQRKLDETGPVNRRVCGRVTTSHRHQLHCSHPACSHTAIKISGTSSSHLSQTAMVRQAKQLPCSSCVPCSTAVGSCGSAASIICPLITESTYLSRHGNYLCHAIASSQDTAHEQPARGTRGS